MPEKPSASIDYATCYPSFIHTVTGPPLIIQIDLWLLQMDLWLTVLVLSVSGKKATTRGVQLDPRFIYQQSKERLCARTPGIEPAELPTIYLRVSTYTIQPPRRDGYWTIFRISFITFIELKILTLAD